MFRQARDLPFGLLVRKVASRLLGTVRTQGRARRDAREGTYLAGLREFVPLPMAVAEVDDGERALLRTLAKRIAGHEFDLLGSGWTRVPSPPAGRALPSGCVDESQRIHSLIEGPYEFIDWQLDFKSGYRWSERTWYTNVPYGHLPGVDVKVPWELARLQHVPALILAARGEEAESASALRREAVNQMLDFVGANPPRFGVNWRTTMEVGIRAANVALALDLLASDGVEGPWIGVLARSLEEHARHIAANLEWSPQARGNHYLANVAGLAWCAGHLAPSPQTASWLSWATQELLVETERQFLEDGANFEASVCYHRLSAEMVAWALSCLASLPESRFLGATAALAPASPPLASTSRPQPRLQKVRARLAGMGAFLEWATKPDGRVVQVGDNDSGRFFRLPGEFLGEVEQPLCPAETVDVLGALCGRRPATPAGRLAQGLVRWEDSPPRVVPMPSFGAVVAPVQLEEPSAAWVFGEGCWDDLETAAFPDFGLFVWRSRRIWMAVRCGPVGQAGLGGHAHNDALHLELTVDGQVWIADPGTGVYTPNPAMRNAYRSAGSHFVPRAGTAEPAPLTHGLFRLKGCGARCHRFGPEGFLGSHDGFGPRVWRSVRLHPQGVSIHDRWEGGDLDPLPVVGPGALWTPIAFSPGYGRFDP